MNNVTFQSDRRPRFEEQGSVVYLMKGKYVFVTQDFSVSIKVSAVHLFSNHRVLGSATG